MCEESELELCLGFGYESDWKRGPQSQEVHRLFGRSERLMEDDIRADRSVYCRRLYGLPHRYDLTSELSKLAVTRTSPNHIRPQTAYECVPA